MSTTDETATAPGPLPHPVHGPHYTDALDQLRTEPAMEKRSRTRQAIDRRHRQEARAARLRACVHLGRLLATHTTQELDDAIGSCARPRLRAAYDTMRTATDSELVLPQAVQLLREARPEWWGISPHLNSQPICDDSTPENPPANHG
ncbi:MULTISPECIES: hypothetical protein [unclassified Streptomyces]|uniref:hypothetical protein n=1 Tax=unclassified Streptomyces TaxID=2593676 RepID=UPI000DB8FA46|nr:MULTISPECIES: hypothetical protein [unclassified Streptomyces]MYT69643.1 hypothetical protein [Streptomyces sp. SID8367]RAJ70707.1 hypothetical protein K377_07783 [Streptomyces sp. PsTaAH-137]